MLYNTIYMRVILASGSPRRQQLLRNIVKEFVIVTTNADERFQFDTPEENVISVAKNKALSIDRTRDDLVIGCDTTVYMDGKYYNKPESEEDARRILTELSGRVHTVFTGVCIAYQDKLRCFYDRSEVEFNQLGLEFINDYILTGSPMDKAGAYGIQDDGIVKNYEGDYSTIMGLPLIRLRTELRENFGYGN